MKTKPLCGSIWYYPILMVLTLMLHAPSCSAQDDGPIDNPGGLSFNQSDPLADATIGEAYSVQFTATGGVIKSYSFDPGHNLPAGMTVKKVSAGFGPKKVRLSGTPEIGTEGEGYFLDVTVKNSAGNTLTETFTFSVIAPEVEPEPEDLTITLPAENVNTITGISNYQGLEGQVFTIGTPSSNAEITSIFDILEVQWSVEGEPDWLIFNASSGMMSGEPPLGAAQDSPYEFDVTLDYKGETATATVEVEVLYNLSIANTVSGLLPGAYENVIYDYTLEVVSKDSAGVPDFTWAMSGFPAQSDLAVDANSGTISGKASIGTASDDPYTITYALYVNGEQYYSNTINFYVYFDLKMNTDSLPNAFPGIPYKQEIETEGGTDPHVLSATGLPPGLALSKEATQSDKVKWFIEGETFEAAAKDKPYVVKLSVWSEVNPDVVTNSTFQLYVSAFMTIKTTSLPPLQVGEPYGPVSLHVKGGVPKHTWTLDAASQQAGLYVEEDAAGKWSLMGTASFDSYTQVDNVVTLTVSDSSKLVQSVQTTFDLSVTPTAPVILTSAIPDGKVGEYFYFTLDAAGGLPGYTWSMTVLLDNEIPSDDFVLEHNEDIDVWWVSASLNDASVGSYTIELELVDSWSVPQFTGEKLFFQILPAEAPPSISIQNSFLPVATEGKPYSVILSAQGGSGDVTWEESFGYGAGMTVVDQGDGTAMFTGVPEGGSAGEYIVQIVAHDNDMEDLADNIALKLVVNPSPDVEDLSAADDQEVAYEALASALADDAAAIGCVLNGSDSGRHLVWGVLVLLLVMHRRTSLRRAQLSHT